MARPIPSIIGGIVIPLLNPTDGEPQQVQDPMTEPTYQGELR